MAQCGQFPVQQGDGARGIGVEHQVVDAVVAVHQANLAVVGRQMLRQPVDQRIHGGYRFGLGVAVLLAPAGDLPREIVAGLMTSSGSVCRSEEHTSELQSLMRISYAVFCLKKKKSYNDSYIIQTL